MHIGILTFQLKLGDSHSLKSKRSQIKPFVNHMHKKFNISISEIDLLEVWDRSVIGCVIVGNEKRFLDSSLKKIYNYMQSTFLDIEFFDEKFEIW
ncbi:MAG TPA: hypothetical protein DCK95_03295 [Anaerolineaceae bacterium]|uniref:YlxP-like protein n=1 Tax=Anaerolinea thermophila TaxID=167964 RepID=A0A101FY85_9CHLR|nr:MAG: hypothetical protein XD73_0457 [Anaerolinea thermophila]HAF61334.1 hypothetical protein [Anaerolineaceae bacterium]